MEGLERGGELLVVEAGILALFLILSESIRFCSIEYDVGCECNTRP